MIKRTFLGLWMARAATAVVLLFCACGLVAGQEQSGSGANSGQAKASQSPQAANGAESEISTRSMDSAIKVRVNLVLVRVVARDGNGNVVADLKKEDFRLLDNGVEQKISTFSVEKADTHGAKQTAAETMKDGANEPSRAPVTDDAKVIPNRFVALVFDDLHMKAAEAMAVHAATAKLFAALTPTDRVAIYSTSGDVQREFTGNTEELRKTLAEMLPRRGIGEGEYECPDITYYMADLIVNKHDPDALATALTESQDNCPLTANDIRANAERILQRNDLLTREGYQHLEKIVMHLTSMPGQRVLVCVSPGFILGDQVMTDNWQLIERAVRAGVVVNTIDAKGLYTADQLPDIAAPSRQPPGKTEMDWQGLESTYRTQAQFESGQVLAGIAASTGGTFFHNRNDLDAAMSRALEAPAVSYLLGFSPQNLKNDGKFHKLKVLMTTPAKYQIQARNGYYAPKKVADPEEMAKQEVRDALFSQDEISDVPVDLKTQFFKTDAASVQLTVLTHLDINGIHFRKAEGRSYNEMVLATAVFDGNGQFVDGQMREIALKLKDSTVERLSHTGFTIKIAFTVKPGTYLVRSVVRGSEGEQMSARNATTVIPN